MINFKKYLLENDTNYVYHGTDSGNLKSIMKQGLKPSESGNPLNFHDDEETTKYYSGKDGITLRVHKNNLPSDTKYQHYTGHHFTKNSVNPDKIEIKHKGEWRPLIKGRKYD